MMLRMPRMATRMPPAMTMRQKAVPSDCWLVASLFRLPSVDTPSAIMAQPRVTRPDEGDSSGQFRSK